jgi:hypothetical protein
VNEASVVAAGALAALLLAWFIVKAVIGHLVAARIAREVGKRRKRRDNPEN